LAQEPKGMDHFVHSTFSRHSWKPFK